MPKYSKKSKAELATCHKDIQKIFNEVIKYFDCTIIEGNRNEDKQNLAFFSGKSKLKYPQSKHNAKPSLAVDVIPYPIDWQDRERMTLFAGFVLGVATQMNIKMRWGGDWNMDTKVKDNKFDDLVHFELVK